MKRTNLLLMVLPLLFVAACSASAELPASSASAPTAVEPAAPADPTATAAAPTAESAGDTSAAEAAVAADPPEESAPADAAAVEPVDWLTVMGRTDEGLATLGNPDATVTMIDYSDFM